MAEVQVHHQTEGSLFITRLIALPVVSSVINFSVRTYQRSKQSYPLVNETMSAAENTAIFIVSSSKPLLTVLKKPISVADKLGVKVLEVLESKMPIITHPTDQVIQESKDYANELRVRALANVLPILTDKSNVAYAWCLEIYETYHAFKLSDVFTMAKSLLTDKYLETVVYLQCYVKGLGDRRLEVQTISRNDAQPNSFDHAYVVGWNEIHSFIWNSIFTSEIMVLRVTAAVLLSAQPLSLRFSKVPVEAK